MKHSNASLFEILVQFLKLGCVAFGGPVAHLGYFQETFVKTRKWLRDEEYADLVALCQFLPGPASSQVGFAIGLKRAGIAGAFAAWVGFTLPSALLMIGFALGLSALGDISQAGWVTGLKLAAVAVVANAIWNMASKLCPDRERALVALLAAATLILLQDALWQIAVIILGGVAGWIFLQRKTQVVPDEESSGGLPKWGWPWLAVFFLLLFTLPILVQSGVVDWLASPDAFYRAGALVFGGGHVVLPLLDAYTVGQGWMDRDTFLAGYGAAQALPGPLFAFSSFLGASMSAGPGGIAGGVLALLAIYLPSWLLVIGAMPYWDRLRRHQSAQAALMGTNAAVVGLLLAAFYNPIGMVAITSPDRLAFAVVGFALLRFVRLPPWALVLLCGACGQLLLQ